MIKLSHDLLPVFEEDVVNNYEYWHATYEYWKSVLYFETPPTYNQFCVTLMARINWYQRYYGTIERDTLSKLIQFALSDLQKGTFNISREYLIYKDASRMPL